MTTEELHLTTSLGTVTGIGAGSTARLPLIVCIPGGSYNSHYFDVAGHSLLTAAHARDFPIVALDRPGYQGSSSLEGEITFAGNAAVLDAAITQLWETYRATATGVVLIGHSMGGAVVVHLAGQQHPWPLLGISVTSIHVDAPDQVSQAWNSMPAEASIPFSKEQRLQFMYGPEGTFDPAVVDAAESSTDLIPVAELREVVGGWIADFEGLAAKVTVPVHYALAEHEQLWNSTYENVRAFADAFTNSPRVNAERVTGSGHNLDHHHDSGPFHDRQLAFVSSVAPA